jgi:hypothetical protein
LFLVKTAFLTIYSLIDFLFNNFEWVGGVLAKKWLKNGLITIFIKKYNISHN